jgi:hypothetical protein
MAVKRLFSPNFLRDPFNLTELAIQRYPAESIDNSIPANFLRKEMLAMLYLQTTVLHIFGRLQDGGTIRK